jgi:hypothetical protein
MVREKCMKAQYSFPDIVVQQNGMSINLGQELANELASPLYTYNVLGGIDVESKKQMKARGVKSPNIADALCLSEYFQNIAYSLWAPRSSNSVRVRSKLRPGETRAFPGAAITTSDSWMYL